MLAQSLDESDLVSHDIKPMSEGSMDSDTGLHMTAFDDSNRFVAYAKTDNWI